MTTLDLLRTLAELDAKATEAPWERFEYGPNCEHATVAHVGAYSVGVPTPGYPGGNYRDTSWGNDSADADLIATMRTAIPTLLRCLAFVVALEEKGSPQKSVSAQDWYVDIELRAAGILEQVLGRE